MKLESVALSGPVTAVLGLDEEEQRVVVGQGSFLCLVERGRAVAKQRVFKGTNVHLIKDFDDRLLGNLPMHGLT